MNGRGAVQRRYAPVARRRGPGGRGVTRANLARAVLVGAVALGAIACSGDGADRADAGSTRAPGAGASTDSQGSDIAYEVPAPHASDWGAPAVPLPDVTLPYGPSPEATADPSFYDVTTLDLAEVTAAMRDLEAGRVCGKVVVTV